MLFKNGEVGKPWAHLLPRAHQVYNYIQSNYQWERAEDQQKRFTIKDVKKKPQQDG